MEGTYSDPTGKKKRKMGAVHYLNVHSDSVAAAHYSVLGNCKAYKHWGGGLVDLDYAKQEKINHYNNN